MREFKYKCAVNGNFRVGNLWGICPKISVGDSGICRAHGNKKCQHKIKIKEIK
jgi:hypothetical protein